MSTLPPTKKQFIPIRTFARVDSRGEMAESAMTGHEDSIRARALRIRETISKGHQIIKPSRGLQYTQSLPSFGQSASLQTSSNIVNDAIFSAGPRNNELRPFGSISDLNSSSSTELERTSSLGSDWTNFKNDNVTSEGDGFDLDDVFGESNLKFGSSPKKRSLEEEQVTKEDLEMEMDDTDVEDEEEPMRTIAPMKTFSKRKFGKTQSMPSLDFGANF